MKNLPRKIILILSKIIKKKFPNNYNFKYKTQKYKLTELLEGIFYVLRTGIGWKDYLKKISGNTLHYHFIRFVKADIFKNTYKDTLLKYLKKNKTGKLKYISTDTIILKNKHGLKSDNVSRNSYFKNKYCTKISKIVDKNGISLHTIIDKGSKNDSNFIKKHLKQMTIKTDAIQYIEANKYKQYFMADAAYDTKQNFKLCRDLGYYVIIPQNIRNIKNPQKIRPLTSFEKNKYKKRIIIENHFAWNQHNKRLHCRYERFSKNLQAFVDFADLILISKYI